jgi:hypothetical protein
MSGKALDLDRTVYELCQADPRIAEILEQAGFREVTRPGMLSTAGRFMTIPKGAALKGIDMDHVRRIFIQHGYEITKGEAP